MYCGPIDELLRREMPKTEPPKEMSMLPTKPKLAAHEVQRISKRPPKTDPAIEFGVRILVNTYMSSQELRSLGETIDKWQKSPRLLCEIILKDLKRIESKSNWTVIYGSFYCQNAAPSDLSVFASHNDRHLAIVRGSWSSGTVAPLSARSASKQLVRRKGFDFSRDPLVTRELERTVESCHANVAPEVCAEVTQLLIKDDGSLDFLAVCGEDYSISLEKNIENPALVFFGELSGMSLFIVRLMPT